MLKVLKWIGIVLGVLLVAGFLFFKIASEPKPTGEQGAAADALAHKMLTAIDKAAWDSTRYVQWTFAGMHDFFWDKEQNLVEVTWGENRVLFSPDELTGKAWKNGEMVSDPDKMVKKAWSFFANDGFWLNAPAKAFDAGTERSLVKLENGEEALMVTYTSGGVTPGDAYLWLLNENGLPTSFKMWAKIVPLKGMESTWSDWETLPTGAKIATTHDTKGLEVKITNLKAGQKLEEMGRVDVFEELE
ncbi:MAG: hypothetical protein AAF599_16115 [Bacteroidota bacterium]